MAVSKLPPLPVGIPPGHSYWNDWYEKLRNLINNVQGSILHNNLTDLQGGTTNQFYHLTSAEHSKVQTLPTTSSGSYTPTLTNVTNVSSSTAYTCYWNRVADTVTVWGRVDVSPTAAAGTATQLGLTLPIASNFSNGSSAELAGAAWATTITSAGSAVLADNTNDRARLQFNATSTSSHPMIFTFSYVIV